MTAMFSNDLKVRNLDLYTVFNLPTAHGRAFVLTMHKGHAAFCSSQESRQPEWKSWPQGRTLI